MYLSEFDFTILTEGLTSTARWVFVHSARQRRHRHDRPGHDPLRSVLLLTIPIPILLIVAAYRAQITRANS